jgi:D-alanyl-D-alanine carboxypeptidase/D-alanyl-D-alanine-endopeptidase (penicillin-binding protein 4)
MRQAAFALAAACSLTLALCTPRLGLRAETPAKAAGPFGAGAGASTPAVEQSLSDLAAWIKGNKGELGASIVDLGSGRVLAERGANLPLNPASNQKLLVAAVALAELGADYRYTTSLHGRIVDGRVERLVLYGTGDPTLELGDVYEWALTLRALGVREVSEIVVDQSHFDASWVPPAFEQQPHEWAAFRAPVAALSLERNAVTVQVEAARSGEPALIWIDPPGFAELQGQVVTGTRAERQSVGLSVRASGQKVRIQVSGRVPEGARRLWV